MQNEILELTKKLINFKTVNGNDKEFAGCFSFIKNFFAKEIRAGKIIVKEYKKNNLPSLVFLNIDTLKPDIILQGHIDVVSAEEKDFAPIIKNGKLYARGAGDMKCEVATMMAVFKELINSGFKNSIVLMLNSDEEIGGDAGAGHLVNEIGYRGKIIIAPDGGNNFELDINEKGLFWIKIISSGKAIHGSRPWLGENAILKLMKLYEKLEIVFPPLKKTKSLYQDGITVNLGKISGGKSVNAVPDKAEMYLDIRYSEKSDKKRIINEIQKLCQKEKLNFEIINSAEMFEVNPENPYVKRFKVIAEKILGRKIKIIKSTGAGDNRFFSAKGMPVIILGPNFAGEHGANEWVEIKSLEKFYKIIKEFLAQI